MSVFQPPQTPFPTHPFESLLPTLINLLKIVHSDNPSSQPQQQHRLAIASAVEDLQSLITHATELINTLPGGEMLPRDQDAVIAALEKLKSEKLAHLARFSDPQVADDQQKAVESPGDAVSMQESSP